MVGIAIICDGELAVPLDSNKDLSQLRINFYGDQVGGVSLTLRKNVKTGNFETIDKTGAVKATYATFALAMTACKSDLLTTKGVTNTDTICDHVASKKAYCPIYIASLQVIP